MQKLLSSIFFVQILMSALTGCSQSDNSRSKSGMKQGLQFFVGEEVSNFDDENEKQIIQLWEDYLLSGEFRNETSPYWVFDEMKIPDEYLWPLDIPTLQTRGYIEQCKIIGIFLAENGFYCLKSAFSHVDDKGEIYLDNIISVYAKKYDGKFLLVNSAQYQKSILEKHAVGAIDYYVHPMHGFDFKKAEEMNEFNLYLAAEFKVDPLKFDYFVADNARDIVKIWGHDYMDRMYIPIQTGGVASINNRIIYSGNNSEYYPHELVHLFTYSIVPKDYHFWIGEGIATFYGGSTGKSLDWHLGKLREFLVDNPDFDLSDIENLPMDVPNGEHMTAFRYVIGGFLCKKIYEKEGVAGLVDGLQTANTNESFFSYIKEKLGVEQNDFDAYVKREVLKIE